MIAEKAIREILDHILVNMLRIGWRVNERMNPGLDEKIVRKLASRVGVEFPKDLIALYEWRNGTNMPVGEEMDSKHFFPGFIFLSLEDAMTTFLSIRDGHGWNPAWFPVFGNGGGDFYAVICDETSESFGSVIGFLLGERTQPVEFESIYTMLQTIDDCFTKGVYYISDEGYLEADDLAAAAVAKVRNPKLELYRDIH